METITQKICRSLRELMGSDDSLTLEYIEAASGVSKSTVHRIKARDIRLRLETAKLLAEFLERETVGKLTVCGLLETTERDFTGRDLRGANFSCQDLSGCSFLDADLRNANLEGAYGTNVDFRVAKLGDANLERVKTKRWDFTGASMVGVNLQDATIDFHSKLGNVDLSSSVFQNFTFSPNGLNSGR